MGADFDVEGYEIEGLLEADASSELWRAREQSTGAPVALKRLVIGEGAVQDKARRLVSVLGRLDHPGLLRVRELTPRESELVLVLDYAERGSLERLLSVRGRLDPGEVVTIAVAAAEALVAMHGRGFVHGGVTPAAIVFKADGTPLVAEPALEPDEAIPAADVRGLAAVCYTALTGVPPGQRPLLEAAPGTPAALAQTVEAGLRSEPAERPSMSAFGAQLESAVSRSPVGFTDVPLFADPVEAEDKDEPPVRRRWWLAAVAALVVVAVGLVAWQLISDARQEEQQTARREVLLDLDRRKAAAWEQLDPGLLSLVYADGSAPLKSEQANMETYVKQGVAKVQGMSWTISSLEVESESDDRVVLKVASRLKPYILTYQDGKRWRVEPKEPERLRITLVPDGSGGWLISRSTEIK